MTKASELASSHIPAHVAEYKKEIISDLVNMMTNYPLIGVVNMENLPAPQLQKMRAQLRADFRIIMTKRRLMKLAIEQVKSSRKGIEQLENHLGGMPALIFTKENPFKLSKTLQKSKSPAPAKAGQTAPRDIVVQKGATSFAPGPIIGELALAGIKSGVEGGKVAIKEDVVVAKAGEKIKSKVAEILTRLGVQPMEVGLDLVAVYENGLIYGRDVLSVDEKEYLNRLQNAARWAFNLAVEASYPTKQTIKVLLGKAHNDAKNLGVAQNIFDKGIVEILLGKAAMQMSSLKSAANIQVVEKEPEKEQTESKTEEKKEQNETKPQEAIQKTESAEIKAPTKEELEANIKMRERQREIKEVEKIARDLQKKAAEEQDSKENSNKKNPIND
ncbi:50S ribosomal protein L10 [Candidatus Woesearchaeota archaeon]|nr:50S ribosomal protein L10 [Candidatus Pacearchaeota archaeon]MBI4452750.1 50S ribosomal protein L10 [Candidatus Woesearchaeota archaeon]